MQKSKFIGLLKELSREELKRFNEYIHSPFFKKSANSIALFEWIYGVEDHPFYRSSMLDNRIVVRSLFSKQNNVDLKYNSLNVTLSELVKLLQHFLAMLEIEKESDYIKFLTIKNLRNRRMDKDFWRMMKKVKLQQTKSDRNIEYYHQQHLLERVMYDFQPTDKRLQREKRKLNLEMYDVLNTFEIYTVLNKLYYCCFNWNSANIIAEEKNINLAHELIDVIKTKGLDKVILVNFYYLSLLLLMKPENESHFFKLKTLLEENTIPIKKEDLLGIYTIATNYCNQKAIKGLGHFHKEMFDLYLLMLEQKLLYQGKFIKKNYIKNIVSLGLQLGKTKWVSRFIEKVKSETLPQYSQSVYAFNKAALFFYTKKYSDVIQGLSEVESIDVYYDLDYRSLLLKCYYELQETEALLSLVDAFKRFTKQQKISDAEKKSYLHFIRCTERLYKTKIHPRKTKASKEKVKVKQFLENVQFIHNQKWLLEKMKELL